MQHVYNKSILSSCRMRTVIAWLVLAATCAVIILGLRAWSSTLGSTPLVDASGAGDIILVESLIGRGEDIDRPQKWYRRFAPIHVAVFQRRTNIVSLLIAEGADLSPGDVDGLSPLYWARMTDDSAIVKMLVDAGATLTVSDNENGMYEEGYTTNTTAENSIPVNTETE
jgi:ankyrin repeat protein